ncbi:response regulator (plasmid) [Azospirillum sp. A26]|uniref:response regulator n=1 Tax=Azospirillum sp. A26 TaxID=3160607 RepID=UPI003672B1B6
MMISQHFRILIVEDDGLVLLGLAETCEAVGYSVTCAYNGKDGLRAFAASPFDVVVTDLKMPVCDGRRMIRELRAEWPCLPIIVVTADPPAGGVRDLIGDAPGMTVLLHKPIPANALLMALRAIFEAKDIS